MVFPAWFPAYLLSLIAMLRVLARVISWEGFYIFIRIFIFRYSFLVLVTHECFLCQLCQASIIVSVFPASLSSFNSQSISLRIGQLIGVIRIQIPFPRRRHQTIWKYCYCCSYSSSIERSAALAPSLNWTFNFNSTIKISTWFWFKLIKSTSYAVLVDPDMKLLLRTVLNKTIQMFMCSFNPISIYDWHRLTEGCCACLHALITVDADLTSSWVVFVFPI